ncbi:DUF4345 domain-containing protein [Nocardia vermiculata]|uniref:DUF4345 domain-containing protein n=1 Tax=Nocardia vermiculata TaxID=257274 RepID=A0A846Y9U0_9NOCA|nr:DUF4345 domain-containing protein [Nocardia vermiculata]NKY53998.1 DUF4345 domain-containing protein [Nocardia vermiculata]
MRRVLQGWLLLFGLVSAGIGVAHLFFGTASIIGAGSVDATVDSDMRFYSVLFTAYGLAWVWCARDVERKVNMINVLGAVFFVGGVARLIAWAATGEPNWFYVLMIPVELVIPVLNYLLVRRVRVVTERRTAGSVADRQPTGRTDLGQVDDPMVRPRPS